jgi:signal transduction histidine kinase
MSAFVDEILAYVGLGDEDSARLRELAPVLGPHFPAIAEEFYEVAAAHTDTASAFSGTEQIARLRVMLIDWMRSGLLGPYDDAFHARRSQIGKRHVQIGLAQQYMFTAMNVIRSAYISRIAVLFPASRAFPYIRSVDKLLDIELAMMLGHYQLASEAKIVHRERQQQSDQLAAIQTLSSGLAHEIRNPLNSAKLQLELLQRRLRRHADDPRLMEPTELAHQEIERLSHLVNDFLAFAQPPSLQLAEHDLVVVAHHVVERERPFAVSRGVTIELIVEEPTIHACIDATKVDQILQNLVRNAIEAAPKGGQVQLRITGDRDRIHVRIDDNGSGIPDRVRARMYEPFFSTKESGTGLGMSIVHSFVLMHGGTIELASTPTGTRFDVALPRGL